MSDIHEDDCDCIHCSPPPQGRRHTVLATFNQSTSSSARELAAELRRAPTHTDARGRNWHARIPTETAEAIAAELERLADLDDYQNERKITSECECHFGQHGADCPQVVRYMQERKHFELSLGELSDGA